MLLIIQSVILCVVFTTIVLPPIYKNPLNVIMSYPTAIRKRVEELPQYQSVIIKHKKKHISAKILAVAVIIIIMTTVAWFSGARTFLQAFKHIFILFSVVNLYDLFILDIWLFCHNKKVIIAGTEDMVKEYKNPRHHIRGAVIGAIIGLFVSLVSGGIIELINNIL